MSVSDRQDQVVSAPTLDVLIAEDDELQRAWMTLQVQRLGCRVTAVEDGVEALDRLRDQAFDVLITDWNMPNMDGLELIRRVRAQRGDRHLHIVMATARDAAGLTREALAAGADEFIRKPVDDLQLELAVESSRRVVRLHRRLARRNRRLAEAQARMREAYRRLTTDLRAAAELQRGLLPAPQADGPVRFDWLMRPSLFIGGDAIGARALENGRRLFFHIDVSGHGVPAALGSFQLHNRLMQMAPATPGALGEAAAAINRELLDQGGGYATLVLALLEADGSCAWLLRAGHPIPLLVPEAGPPRWLGEGGPPLGLLPDAAPEVSRTALAPGDRLLLYSDGVTDAPLNAAINLPSGEGWGEEGLLAWAAGLGARSPAAGVAALGDLVDEAMGRRPPPDDLSLLIIQRAKGDTE